MRELITRATQALIDTSTGLRLIGAAVVAVLLIGPATALAQQPATRTEEVSASFTIEAIDHSSRVVTLRNKAGLLEEVYAVPRCSASTSSRSATWSPSGTTRRSSPR